MVVGFTLALAATISAGPSRVLSGAVISSDREFPLAAVVLRLEKQGLFSNFSQTVTSDMNGQYTFGPVPAGRYTLTAAMTGYRSFKRDILIANDTQLEPVTIRMAPASGVSGCDTCQAVSLVLGKIIDAERKAPVSGARVRVSGGSATKETTAEGIFSFTDLPEGTHSFITTHPHFHNDSTGEYPVASGKPTDITIILQPLQTVEDTSGSLTGQVVDSATGKPVPHASVSILNSEHTTIADNTGHFTLSPLPVGSYTVLVAKWGYESQAFSNVSVRARGAGRIDPVLAPRQTGMSGEAAGALTGQVTDEKGSPFEKAIVFIEETGSAALTDAFGHFTIEDVESGVYTVKAFSEGYDTATATEVDVWGGEETEVALQLNKAVALDSDYAGDAGRIAGILVDAEKGTPLSGVAVTLEGTRHQTVSDLSGAFAFEGVEPGTYAVRAIYSGYDDAASAPVELAEGQSARVDLTLKPSGVKQMARMTIRSAAAQNTDAALLKARQSEISFTDAIGSQELSRAGAGNAADAMKSVTGATVVGGKYVLIRGLPESYTITMLNGLPLPSPDPDKQAVNMDLFPSGIIENITTYKTLTPNLPANWAGGIVDIRTKPYPESFTLSLSAAGSYTHGTTFSTMKTYEGSSTDWLGFDDGTRKMPSVFEKYPKTELEKITALPQGNISGARFGNRMRDPDDNLRDTMALLSTMARSLNTSMEPTTMTALPNQSYSLSLGNTFTLRERPLGFRLGLTYSSKAQFIEAGDYIDYTFAAPTEGSDELVEPNPDNDFRKTNSTRSILWSVLANTAYTFSDKHSIKLDYLFVQGADDDVQEVSGHYRYYDGWNNYSTRRLHFTQRSLSFAGLSGSHRIAGRYDPYALSWRASLTSGSQRDPDMRDIYHFTNPWTEGRSWYGYEANIGEPSHQWRDLDENAASSSVSLAIPFYQWFDDSATATVGSSWFGKSRKRRQRDLEYMLDFYLNSTGTLAPEIETRFDPPQHWIDHEHLGLLGDSTSDLSTTPAVTPTESGYRPGIFILDNSQDAAQWDGTLHVMSGFGMVELPLFGPLTLTGGLRYEYSYMYGETIVEEFQEDSTVARLNDHDLLPALSLNLALRKNMNVRVAGSRTLIRPSMRQKAEYSTEDFTGGPTYTGNAQLEISLVDNADVRWEWFINPGELLAASAFYKTIHNPIELEFQPNDVRKPANTSTDAHILGLEVEGRLQLMDHLKASGNITLAYSRVNLDSTMTKYEAIFPDAPDHRPFQGQSPYVINLFLTYDNPDIGLTAGLYYNVFGERLAELTAQDVPWLWEKPVHTLNMTLSYDLTERVAVKGKVKNMLDAEKKLVHHYDGKEWGSRSSGKGVEVQAGIGLKF
jgi:protocatechuate 3,4-dioxygenase beta subunit